MDFCRVFAVYGTIKLIMPVDVEIFFGLYYLPLIFVVVPNKIKDDVLYPRTVVARGGQLSQRLGRF